MIRQERLSHRLDELDADERLVADSQIACGCFDINELMRDGATLFDDLMRLDEHLRYLWFKDTASYSKAADDAVRNSVARWYGITKRVLAQFEKISIACDERGFDRVNYDSLKNRFTLACAILHPTDAEDSRLADEAIEQYHSGETVPM